MIRQMLAVCLFMLLPSLAMATTRYVDGSPGTNCSGNYSIANRTCTGTDGNSYLHVNGATALMGAGDTTYVRGGTYTGEGTIRLGTTGTQAQPIVLRNYPGESPVIDWGDASPFSVSTNQLLIQKTGTLGEIGWITIQGLELKNGWAPINLEGAHDIVISQNYVHDNRGGLGLIGKNILIDRNRIIHNGDFVLCTQQPSNCSVNHGIYAIGSNWTITHNIISHGLAYGIQVAGYAFNASTMPDTTYSGASNFLIANNTIAYEANRGAIILWNNGTAPSGTIIKNNILFQNNLSGGTGGSNPSGVDFLGSSTGGIINNNTFYANGTANTTFAGSCSGCYTTSNNSTSTNPNMTSTPLSTYNNVPANPDFTLTSSSAAAIDTGVAISGLSYNGTAPDAGAYESFGYSSASINTNLLDLTLGMSLNTPVLPASGATGFTVSCTGAGCGTPTVSSVNILQGSSTVLRLSLSGITGNACAGGQTWTVTYNPGTVTDSALIGNSLNQSMFAFSSKAVTNNCTGGGATEPAGAHIIYHLDDNTGTTATDSSGNGLNGTLVNGPTWVTGFESFAVHFGTPQTTDGITIPYGNTINPSTQALTICFGVAIDAGSESSTRMVFAAPITAGQLFYLSNEAGTWALGVQSSGAASNSDFPVSAGWNRICLVSDTSKVTLWVNGVAGTGAQSVKSYTSYALSGNFELGRFPTENLALPGMTIDEFYLWTSALTASDIANDYAVWQPASAPNACTRTQKTHQFQKLRIMGDGSAENIGAQGGALTVVVGAAFALVIQTDATVADCAVFNQALRYSLSGGSFIDVPDIMGGDQVAFYQSTSDSSVLSGSVTCCLTGALTANSGITVYTSAAIPTITLLQDNSIVQRYIVRFGTSASVGAQYCFKVYDQNGNAFDTYAPTGGACVTVQGMMSGVGF